MQMPTQKPRVNFGSLAERMRSTREQVGIVQDMENLDYRERSEIAGMTADQAENDEQKVALEQISTAQTRFNVDPYMRYTYTKAYILGLLRAKNFNPDTALAAILLAKSVVMPGDK